MQGGWVRHWSRDKRVSGGWPGQTRCECERDSERKRGIGRGAVNVKKKKRKRCGHVM